MKTLRLLLCFIILVATSMSVAAQTYTAGRESYMSWDEFVTEFMEGSADITDEQDEAARTDLLERLEELHNTPININTADRETLLRLPLLTESQADSLLAYRTQKRFLLSLGELQFISGFTYTDRRRLSLFAFAGDSLQKAATLRQRLTKGQHELSTLFHLPLYTRAGMASASEAEIHEHPSRYYMGGNWASTMRYRYSHASGTAYGLTLQNDLGEPFAKLQNYPYDYTSAYAVYTPINRKWRLLLGDYEVQAGEGLLAANRFYGGRTMLLIALPTAGGAVRPHTSTDEDRFLRGAAATLTSGHWQHTAFASWRQRDARIEHDSVRTLYTDGLHRSMTELTHRRTLNNITAGLRTEFRREGLRIGGTFIFDHYAQPIAPPLQNYNRYYLRGQTAAGISADYRLHQRRLTAQGEIATDRNGHLATLHTVRIEPESGLSFTLQGRYISPRYVAPHSDAQIQNSRTQNEVGLLASFTLNRFKRIELQGYADFFTFPRPTYTASAYGSKGVETWFQAKYMPSAPLYLLLSYKLKSRQRNIAGHKGTLEYVTNHRVRLAANYSPTPRVTLYAAADATLLTTQTANARTGWMLSGRSSWQCTSRLKFNFFAATFFTADYATRLYAYEPQLRYAGAFPSFAYHGMKYVAQTAWRVSPTLQVAARFSTLHYFNRSQISSGSQLINASSQNDLSLQIIWQP